MARKIVVLDGGTMAAVDPAELRHHCERWIIVDPAQRLYRLEHSCVVGSEIVTLNGLVLDLDQDYGLAGGSFEPSRLVLVADFPLSPGDKLAIRYWTA